MKKLVTIFFLFLFLTANTAFGEVLKMPLLIHHYIEHTQEDNDNSFGDFLAKHYGGNINHRHNDNHHDHERLPFKTTGCHSVLVVSLVPLSSLLLENIPVVADGKIPIHNQQDHSNAYLSSIWQPPRF